jgi:zinc protease
MKTIVKIISCVLVTLISGGSFAQIEMAPAGGTPKDFLLPPVKAFRLENGLSVTLVPFGNIPKVTISLVIRSGNLNEARDEVWLADFTGNLMKEGTSTRTGQQIADEAAAMGGTLYISTGIETTSVSGDVLSEFATGMIGLIADVVMNPGFPASEVDRLKSDMLRVLNIQKTQPDLIAFELFSKVLYPDHPYGRIFPDQSVIESFSAEKAGKFYRDNFGAQRSHIYITGVFDEAAVEKTIRSTFKSWAKGADPLINIPAAVRKPSIYISNRPGAPQSVLNIGLPVVDPSNKDYLPLLLTDNLLGGSFTSRITLNIRENKGYTYSPNSDVTSRYRTAFWMQFAEVGTDVTAPAIKEIFYEISRLANDPVPEEELSGIKNYMTGIFIMSNSTRRGIINQLAFLDLHDLDISYLNSYVKKVQAITSSEVQNIMNAYLKPSDMTIVIAGDRNKIEKYVTPFGKIVN